MHDASLISHLADRVLGLAHGRLVFDRPASQLTDTELQSLYETPALNKGQTSSVHMRPQHHEKRLATS